MKTKQHILKIKYTLIVLFLSFSLNAQEYLWSEVSKAEVSSFDTSDDYKVFKLNQRHFLKKLDQSSLKIKGDTVVFPTENGKEERFIIRKNEVLSPKLKAKFPQLSSYVGKNIKGNKTVYFSTSPYGVNAVFYENGKRPIYLDPKGKNYVRYRASSVNKQGFKCEVRGNKTTFSTQNKGLKKRENNDNKLRTFRLALAVTGEYSQYHLKLQGVPNTATEHEKKMAVLSAIQNAITRVNSVYERDLSIHLNLVDNNDLLIFLDPKTDGLSNNSAYGIIDESKNIINNAIGFDNYDIGHTFSTGVGGLAGLESVCKDNKYEGATGMPDPTGDAYHIDYVCHEMGHQFGATHTFNGSAGDCGGYNNRINITAFEPGSGSTIMGYAGICGNENIQPHTDAYFHYVSILQIMLYVETLSCPTITKINNTAPEVKPLKSYVIPISTPFALTAEATDKEGDQLTYTWEQLDNEIVDIPLVSTNTGGPAFRSIFPSESATRYFPNMKTVLSNQLKNKWEVLPSVSRDMKFSVTVRDNHIKGGRTSSEEMKVSFTNKGGAFEVTSQDEKEEWTGGGLHTIKWEVANTNVAPINCKKVSILFSADGGQTFPYKLAGNIPNNGKIILKAPNIDTTKGRIKVKSEGNIFYAINKSEITVKKSDLINKKFTEIRAFPNPTTGRVEISLPNTKRDKVKVTLVDFLGNVFSQKMYQVVSERIVLDISHLPNRIYFAIIEGEKKRNIKIVKQE
ncbi:MAG: zinc-dependent metalloprotease [Flavobacteriaceae bacterium]|nr:zinc-dependent metalloprotease [Flavobacteriaceae bacterium]